MVNKKALQLRSDLSNGVDRKEIMSKFNLNKDQYARIVYRKTWKHI